MPLHSTSKHPPKGWLYRELIAGRYWTAPDPMLGFEMVAKALCAARANNKVKTTLAECKEAVANFTCKRLDNDVRWCVQASNPQAAAVAAKAKRECAGCGRKRKK
jgi:hypothetical protein